VEVTLLFCNQAAVEPDGKLSLRGVMSELYAPAFPARQDRLFLAGFIRWQRADEGNKEFLIHLKDPDGLAIFTIEGHTDVDSRPETRPPAITQLVLPMENLIFAVAGEYQVEVAVAGQQIIGPKLYLMESAETDL
jgi:hypothetical protein